MEGRRRQALSVSAALLLLLGLVALAGCGGGGGGDKNAAAKTQLVRFQAPTAPGPKPFTKPADVKGKKKVDVGSGPYGGTGSDLVCDRELLIRSLKAYPDRLRAWAEVRGIEPTYTAVARYIRKLRPTTLIVDTRVTNYTFVNGRAVGFQAILQAGTAVLVDKYGEIVARCRCGNPLTKPVYVPTATCYGCPPNYTPPKPCTGRDCYTAYPDPPPVTTAQSTPSTTTSTTPSTGGTTQEQPSASWNRSSGTTGDQYVFSISGFAPNSSIAFTLTRPSGVTENYTITTDASGSGSHTFPPTNASSENGTYTGLARNPSTGASATATTSFENTNSSGGGGGTDTGTTESTPGPGPGGGEQSDLPVCDPNAPVEPCRPG